MSSTPAITDAQLHAMWSACLEISSVSGAHQACERLSERLEEIISAPAPIYRRKVSRWQPVRRGASEGAAVLDPRVKAYQQFTACAPPIYLPVNGPDDVAWTPLPLDGDRRSQTVLLLPGDWRQGQAAPWLSRFARTASLGLRLAAIRGGFHKRDRVVHGAYSFARRVTRVSGIPNLHQFVIDEAARQTHARLGGLAVYRREEGAIAIAATHGYPSEVVGDTRIVPGSGIIGSVFATRRPLLVRDTTRVPELTPRSRYQTRSFMAIPLIAGNQALGVMTLADRRDSRPFTREDLAMARVIGAVSSLAIEREQLSQTSRELAQVAALEPLTGMYTRRHLQTQLEAELKRSRRTATPISLMMIDVDSFKRINDQMGHQAGDVVLRKVAETIRATVRESDVCARYGGDEFSVIITDSATNGARTAERIRSRIAAFQWESVGLPKTLQVTASIGVAMSQAEDDSSTVMVRADRAMYVAKAQGRNRVFLAEQPQASPLRPDERTTR